MNVASSHEMLSKSTIATVPDAFGNVLVTVRGFPVAEYADPLVLVISLVAL